MTANQARKGENGRAEVAAVANDGQIRLPVEIQDKDEEAEEFDKSAERFLNLNAICFYRARF